MPAMPAIRMRSRTRRGGRPTSPHRRWHRPRTAHPARRRRRSWRSTPGSPREHLLPVLLAPAAAVGAETSAVHQRRLRRPGGLRRPARRRAGRRRPLRPVPGARRGRGRVLHRRRPPRPRAWPRSCSSTSPPPARETGIAASPRRCCPRTGRCWACSSRSASRRTPLRRRRDRGQLRHRPTDRGRGRHRGAGAPGRGADRSPGCSSPHSVAVIGRPAAARARSATRCCAGSSAHEFAGPGVPGEPGGAHVAACGPGRRSSTSPTRSTWPWSCVPAEEVLDAVEECAARTGAGRWSSSRRASPTAGDDGRSSASRPSSSSPAATACGCIGPARSAS